MIIFESDYMCELITVYTYNLDLFNYNFKYTGFLQLP